MLLVAQALVAQALESHLATYNYAHEDAKNDLHCGVGPKLKWGLGYLLSGIAGANLSLGKLLRSASAVQTDKG